MFVYVVVTKFREGKWIKVFKNKEDAKKSVVAISEEDDWVSSDILTKQLF